MDKTEERIDSRIDDLSVKHKSLLIYERAVDASLARESAMMEKELERARSVEFCQLLDDRKENSRKGTAGSQNIRDVVKEIPDMHGRSIRSGKDPVIRGLESGLKVMVRASSTNLNSRPAGNPEIEDRNTEMVLSCHAKPITESPVTIYPSEQRKETTGEARGKITNAPNLVKKREGGFYENSPSIAVTRTKDITKPSLSSPIREPEDPGCFSIPCTINGKQIPKCVIDLGASKSMMSLKMAKLTGITKVKRTTTKLVLADWTTRELVGIAENVIVDYGNSRFLTDFMILDTAEDPSGRVILGRPFLAASKAQISMGEGTITFGDEKPRGEPEKRNFGQDKDQKSQASNNFNEYGFYLGTIEGAEHAGKGKSSDKRKTAKKKRWRLKGVTDPGSASYDPPGTLREFPAHQS